MKRGLIQSKPIALAILFSTSAAWSGCSSARDDFFVPVPEGDRRMVYELSAPSGEAVAAADPVIDDAVDDAVCLLRTDRPWECTEPDPDPPVCTTRSKEEIRAAIEPVFRAIPGIEITSGAASVSEVRHALPDTTLLVTYMILDARRERECRQFRPEGGCVAVQTDQLWILLYAPPEGGRIDRFEVFIDESQRRAVCQEKPTD